MNTLESELYLILQKWEEEYDYTKSDTTLQDMETKEKLATLCQQQPKGRIIIRTQSKWYEEGETCIKLVLPKFR